LRPLTPTAPVTRSGEPVGEPAETSRRRRPQVLQAGSRAADVGMVTLLRRLGLAALAILVLAAPAESRAPSAQANQTERQVIAAINAVRAEHGLKPLRFATPLFRAARKHSRDMGENDYFSHSSEDSGESFDQRVLRFQDRRQVRWLGETIGWGC